jgi:hypothetical protein
MFSFHPNSKSLTAHLERALQVLFLPLSGSSCTTSSSLLLLLLLLLLLVKGEFTLHVSLSESSLQLPILMAGQHKSWVGNQILQWHLIFLGCFVSYSWDLEFGGLLVFSKIFAPLS